MIDTVPVRPEDEPFLLALYRSTRRQEVAAWGWPLEQQEAFLRMQFRAQYQVYQRQYPDADHRLIIAGGQRAGRILTARTADALVLVDIALLPAFRGRGIGTGLIGRLQAEAARERLPVRLHVLRGSRARRLYERLGFVITGEHGPYHAMQWTDAEGSAMLSTCTADTFTPHLHSRFRACPEPSRAVELTLDEVRELPSGPGQIQFSLLFRGPSEPFLPQATYPVEHGELGRFPLFLVPVGRTDDGYRYEAVFSRLVREEREDHHLRRQGPAASEAGKEDRHE